MKRVLSLMCIAALAFTSCSRDEIRETQSPESISFRTPALTKAQEVSSIDKLDDIGFYVTAYLVKETESTPEYSLYFNNEHYFWSLESFVSETPYYWPSDGSELKFYAFSPASTEFGVEAPTTADNGSLMFEDFTPAESIFEQDDLLVAVKATSEDQAKDDFENQENQTTERHAGIALEFSHALSQIRINAINNHERYVVKVKGVKLGNIPTGATYTFGETGSWSFPASPELADYTATYNDPVTLGSNSSALLPNEEGAMIIPQQLTAWDPATPDDGGAYIGVLVNITTKADDSSEAASQAYPATKGEYDWVAIPISTNLETGMKYTYTLDFSDGAGYDETTGTRIGNDIKFNVRVSDWSVEYVVKRNDSWMVGKWKAYKFEEDSYPDDGNDEPNIVIDLTELEEGSSEYTSTLNQLKGYVDLLYYFEINDTDNRLYPLNEDGSLMGGNVTFTYSASDEEGKIGTFVIPTLMANADILEYANGKAKVFLDVNTSGTKRKQWAYYDIVHDSNN